MDHTLPCGHCGAVFVPTLSQWNHRHYGEQCEVYCSPLCRSAGESHRKRRPKPVYGPCPTCGVHFESRVPKTFCSLRCYTRSPGFRERTRTMGQLAAPRPKRREQRTCLECGAPFEVQPHVKKKFCSAAHYRLYMAKRFDRWIANPQSLALPQAYDEFLTSDELPCLVEGCGWRGHWLSLHMNYTHGVPVDEFKRAAGFNLHSGIISAPTRANLAQRPQCLQPGDGAFLGAGAPRRYIQRYQSLEGKEHRHKALALVLVQQGPTRTCKGCGRTFTQSTVQGRTLFCTRPCRNEWYRVDNAKHDHTATCAVCGITFACSRSQYRRAIRALPVCCGDVCKGKLNGSKPKPKARKST